MSSAGVRLVGGPHRALLVGAGLFLAFAALAASGWARVLSLPSFTAQPRPLPIDVVHDIGGGVVFAAIGFVIWRRRPGTVIGPLMVVIGASLFGWALQWVPMPPLVTAGQWLERTAPAFIGALLLLYPAGRIDSRLERAWLLGALALLALGVAHVLVSPIAKLECDGCHSWIVLRYDENLSNNLWVLEFNVLVVLVVGLVVLLVRRWLRASRPLRRVMLPLWVAGAAFGAGVALRIVLDSTGYWANWFADIPPIGALLGIQPPTTLLAVLPFVDVAALFLIPLALLWGQVSSRSGHVAVSGLAIRLRSGHDAVPIEDLLREAVGDPSLQLALWSRPAGTYVTPGGQPVSMPEDRGRAVTRLDGDDGPLAAIVHDPALSERRRLIDGVSAVAQLAIENERLHAEVRSQLAEVRASRQRIVSAADDERRRVERNLHDGAQQRLVSVSMALRMARARAVDGPPDVVATLADAEAELKEAIGELRELARGIHPAILTEAGLGPALESLADHAPLPVAVDTRLNGRLPAVVEATAYFVAAEALTNVAKHAAATAATLRAAVQDGRLVIVVADNGTGGADPDRGSGIRGLMDRVAALGGTLRVAEVTEGGTRLEAEIPCA